MTQENKQLLLSDLCARLPYYTMVLMGDGGVELLVSVNVDTGICNGLKGLPKPYLRPLSNMTEEEQEEFGNLVGLWKDQRTSRFVNRIPDLSEFGKTLVTEVIIARAIDWLNAHHFDYRGLIEMGLALEAPDGMYKL